MHDPFTSPTEDEDDAAVEAALTAEAIVMAEAAAIHCAGPATLQGLAVGCCHCMELAKDGDPDGGP